MRLGTRLALIAVIGTAGTLITAVHGYNLLEQLRVGGPVYANAVRAKDLIADILPPPGFLVELHLQAYQVANGNLSPAEFKTEAEVRIRECRARYAHWQDDLPQHSQAIRSLREQFFGPTATTAEAYLSAVETSLLPSLQSDSAVLKQLVAENLEHLFVVHRAAVVEAVQRATNWAQEVEASANQTTHSGISTGALTIILVVLALGSTWYFMARGLRLSVKRAQRSVERIAKGDTEHQGIEQIRDELDALLQQLGHLAQSLASRSDLAAAVAHGDLRPDVALASEQDRLGLALRDMVAGLRTRVTVLDRQARSLATASGEITDAAGSLSQGATEQAASLEEINATMIEIASGAVRAAEAAKQADARAATAKEAGTQGVQILRELETAMGEITTATQNIATILKTIDGIAFQTNLLALNAAVEAARAGKHGKGFAVVADEVRALAARSAKAAKESADLIHSTNERVQRGVGAAGRVSTALEGIAQAVGDTAALVASIAHNAQQQAAAVSEVRDGLNQIEAVTQGNTAQAEQTAASASELSRTARELSELVGNFKVPNQLSGPSATAAPLTISLQ